MATPATATRNAKEVVDQLRYSNDLNSTAIKVLAFECVNHVKNPDFAEDFLDRDGLMTLIEIITKVSYGSAIQGVALQVLRGLCIYVNAIETFSDSPDLVDKIWALLTPPTDGKLSLPVAKAALELLIVLVGHVATGHKLVNNSAKHKLGYEQSAYGCLVPLLACQESTCIGKTLTFVNLMMKKKKEASETKAKKLLFRLKQCGFLGMLQKLTVIEDDVVRRQLAAFQKLTNFTVPRSWEEAEKYRLQYEEMKSRYDKASESLFVYQQQQAKVRLLKNEFQKAQDTIRALGLAVPSLSRNFHPTKRFSDGGGISISELVRSDPTKVDQLNIDASATDALRGKLLEHFLQQPDVKLKAEKILGPRVAPGAVGGRSRVAGHFDPLSSIYGYDDVPDAPPPPDDFDAPPPPDDDADAPPPEDDDDDLPPEGDSEDDLPPQEDGTPSPPRRPRKSGGGKSAGRKVGTGKAGASPAKAGAFNPNDIPDAPPPPEPSAPTSSSSPQATPAPPKLGEALVDAPHTIAGKLPMPPPLPTALPPPPPLPGLPPAPPVLGVKLPSVPPPPGNLAAAAKPVDNRLWYHGPAPDKKMRPLHWDKVDEAADAANTIWSRVHEAGQETYTIDFEDFISKFSQKDVNKPDKKVEEAKPAKLMLIDPKTFMNLSIMLHKLPAIPKIQRALLDLDSAQLDRAMLKGLLSGIDPKSLAPEVVKTFVTRQNEKPVEEYEVPEQFVAMVLSVTEFRRRVQTWHFTLNWEESMEGMRAPMKRFHAALTSILASQHLPYYLGILLGFGNIMNHGNNRKGNAPGFALNLLGKLDASKDNCGKVSLLQYLLTTVQKSNPEALELHEELKPLFDNVAAMKMDELEKSVKDAEMQMKSFVSQCNGVKKALTEDGTVDTDPFVPTMAAFQIVAAKELEEAKAEFESLQATSVEVVRFLAYPEGTKSEEILKELIPFVEKVKRTAVEAAKEKKRAARKGQKLEGHDLDNLVGKLQAAME